MSKLPLIEKIKYTLVQPHYPEVGLEFNTDSIRLASVESMKGRLHVTHLDSEPLPAGSMDINPFKQNILSLEPVAEALKALWSRNRKKESKVSLLLQDRAALTFNLILESASANAQEFQDLIRFKLKKSVPFRIEEAHIGFFNPAGLPDSSGTNFWVTLIHNSVLHQYEKLIESTIDSECGLVDLVTLNAMNLCHEEIKRSNLQQQDLLYVNLNQDYISIAITQKGNLVFYRNRALEKQDEILDEALAEIHPTTMFYVDKLAGQNLAEVFIYSPAKSEELRDRIEKELALKASILSIESFAGNRFDLSNKDFISMYAPLIGLLVSRKVEFA